MPLKIFERGGKSSPLVCAEPHTSSAITLFTWIHTKTHVVRESPEQGWPHCKSITRTLGRSEGQCTISVSSGKRYVYFQQDKYKSCMSQSYVKFTSTCSLLV